MRSRSERNGIDQREQRQERDGNRQMGETTHKRKNTEKYGKTTHPRDTAAPCTIVYRKAGTHTFSAFFARDAGREGPPREKKRGALHRGSEGVTKGKLHNDSLEWLAYICRQN